MLSCKVQGHGYVRRPDHFFLISSPADTFSVGHWSWRRTRLLNGVDRSIAMVIIDWVWVDVFYFFDSSVPLLPVDGQKPPCIPRGGILSFLSELYYLFVYALLPVCRVPPFLLSDFIVIEYCKSAKCNKGAYKAFEFKFHIRSKCGHNCFDTGKDFKCGTV